MNIGIILAAGEGTRMRSKKAKVLHSICGRPMIDYVIHASRLSGIQKNVVIVGHGKDEVIKAVNMEDVLFEEQPIHQGAPYGTGFAVMQGLDHITDEDLVLVLCADTPLITETTLKRLLEYHRESNNVATVLTTDLMDPKGYGRIIRKENDDLLKIVEHKDANAWELEVKEINSGIYCFKGKSLKESLSKIGNDNVQNEYYLTDVISVLNEDGFKVGAFKIQDDTEIYGINSRVQLAFAQRVMSRRINEFHMENGVTLIDPESVIIQKGVKIGRDTIIYPGAILEGDTIIGEDCIIRGNTRIVDSQISDGVEIESTLVESSTVGDYCHIGPYAHLRPNSILGRNIKIGNFVEVKNATLDDNTKASHLSYIGDAQVGKSVNIGCGVVFVNYNGQSKSKSIVEDNAFVGSNSNLVAPVTIKEWGYIAAGSTITDDVGEGDLSIARARQVNKAGWVEKKGFKKHK